MRAAPSQIGGSDMIERETKRVADPGRDNTFVITPGEPPKDTPIFQPMPDPAPITTPANPNPGPKPAVADPAREAEVGA